MNPLFKVGNVVRVNWDKSEGYIIKSLLPTKSKDYSDGLSYEVEGLWSKKKSWTSASSMTLVMKSRNFLSETTIDDLTDEDRKVIIDYRDGSPKEIIDLPTYHWLWLVRNGWSEKEAMKYQKSMMKIEMEKEEARWEQLSLF